MIDPETAKADVQAWNDACAINTADEREDAVYPAGDALAVLVPQLLDQLATGEEWKRKAMGYAQELITLRPELDALGERCRQAEQERDAAQRVAKRQEDARAQAEQVADTARDDLLAAELDRDAAIDRLGQLERELGYETD